MSASSYKIARRIGRGGMAEVYLAMREGVGGFEKLVVLKRIFSHYGEDERFITMFLDEARLAASIGHPNVVEIFDIGQDEEGYFMAMEYLSGETLAFIFEVLLRRRQALPIPIVARICADVAAGLHYAHTATNAQGVRLGIVHRDVTPSNIIVCFNGTTKIVDFGIAKAELRDSKTKSGALKGKMAYLSPEQIEDGVVDHRTDIFQLGICLHEMMTGARLFHAEGDHQKMMAVLERPILPPSQLNPYVPAIFDEIVLRALDRDASKRTQTADLLRRELEDALKKLGTTVSDHDVADWMQSTFADRFRERVTMERDSASKIRTGARVRRQTPTLAPEEAQRSETEIASPGARSRSAQRGQRWVPLAAGAVIAVAVFIGAMLRWSDQHEAPKPAVADAQPAAAATARPEAASFIVRLRVLPSIAKISVDGESIGRGGMARSFPVDGRNHTLRIDAEGYESLEFSFRDLSPVADSAVIELERAGGATTATPSPVGERKPAKGLKKPASEEPARNARADAGAAPGPKASDAAPAQPTDSASENKNGDDSWKKQPGSDNINPWNSP